MYGRFRSCSMAYGFPKKPTLGCFQALLAHIKRTTPHSKLVHACSPTAKVNVANRRIKLAANER